jgi:hypothetical protein
MFVYSLIDDVISRKSLGNSNAQFLRKLMRLGTILTHPISIRSRFEITGHPNAAKFFEIDPTNGALKVKDIPDLEVTRVVDFKGHAIQGSPKPTSATVSITITITGKNDNQPEFKDGFYNFQTPCDYYPVHYASNIIGKVTAKDPDSRQE